MKPFPIGLNGFFLERHLFTASTAANQALWCWLTEPAVHITQKNNATNKTCKIIVNSSVSNIHLSRQQSPSDSSSKVFGVFYTSESLLSEEAAVTHPPRFFLISLTSFLAAHSEQREQAALEPFDVPLGRMCWTTTYSDAFFFPTGGWNEERCGRKSCERPFLYVSYTMVCLSVEGRPSGRCGWQGKSLCTCSPSQKNGIGWLPEVTHTLTFAVYSI